MPKSELGIFKRDFIGYGEHPPKIAWPNNARIAVQIVVNYEAGSERHVLEGDESPETYGEFAAYGAPTKRDLAMDSIFEYGSRVGVWRFLRIFKKHDVKVTFFATARALEKNPVLARRIVEEGHEVCSHGYRWIEHYTLTVDEEREVIRKAVETIEKLTGQRPLGWYCREPSVNTIKLLIEEGGFLYNSDIYNDDLPYYCEYNGRQILLIPYTPDANDFHFFSNRFTTAEDFFTYLKDTFDLLYEEGRENPKMMSIGLHDRISSRPGRAIGIDKFLSYIKSYRDVWIARRIDIARWWWENYPPSKIPYRLIID
ncbi:MAG: allantoinase PuuE [Candidatus Caldarchaeales archaeon]